MSRAVLVVDGQLKCARCGIVKPVSEFSKGKNKSGYKSYCKQCVHEQYEADKERILKQHKEYYEGNKEQYLQTCKVYREAHKEEKSAYAKEYYQKNNEKYEKGLADSLKTLLRSN